MRRPDELGRAGDVAPRPSHAVEGSELSVPPLPPREGRLLHGHRRGNGRLWRRLARAPEAVAARPEGRSTPMSARLPRAARRALRGHRSQSGAVPPLYFGHAAAPHTAWWDTPACSAWHHRVPWSAASNRSASKVTVRGTACRRRAGAGPGRRSTGACSGSAARRVRTG